MGKTRDLFKKIRDTKGTFHAKMGFTDGILMAYSACLLGLCISSKLATEFPVFIRLIVIPFCNTINCYTFLYVHIMSTLSFFVRLPVFNVHCPDPLIHWGLQNFDILILSYCFTYYPNSFIKKDLKCDWFLHFICMVFKIVNCISVIQRS